jgi:quercetin dioxygenase-like cupin family protein
MEIKRSGSQPSTKGPTEYFTGNVRIDPMFQAAEPSRVSASLVTFEPGARTAWHTQRGNPARRCDLVSTRSQALAWGDGNDGH